MVYRSHALRGSAVPEALRPLLKMTQSVTNCMPTRSAGTIVINATQSGADERSYRSHALRGSAVPDALRPVLKMTRSVTNCMPTRSAGTIVINATRSGADDAAIFAGDDHH